MSPSWVSREFRFGSRPGRSDRGSDFMQRNRSGLTCCIIVATKRSRGGSFIQLAKAIRPKLDSRGIRSAITTARSHMRVLRKDISILVSSSATRLSTPVAAIPEPCNVDGDLLNNKFTLLKAMQSFLCTPATLIQLLIISFSQ